MATTPTTREKLPNFESWCITQSEILTILFKWSIRNFAFHTGKPGFWLKSDNFPSEAVHGTKWSLVAYPSGYNTEESGHLSLHLRLVFDTSEIKPSVRFRCSILDSENNKTNTKQSSCPFTFDKEKSQQWGWNKFIETEVLTSNADDFLPNKTLTILFELELLVQLPSKSGTASTTDVPESRLGDDFLGLFEKELFSDVTLVVDGEKFKVHRSILAARSAVFEAMFTSEMKEKNQNVIEIKDMDRDVMYNMLSFMYTSKAPTDTDLKLMCNLLAASDRYNLERLKIICEGILCPQINTDNVSDLLLLAYLHCAGKLKATTLEFVNNHVTAVLKCKNWLSLMQSNPELVSEVLEYIYTKQSEK